MITRNSEIQKRSTHRQGILFVDLVTIPRVVGFPGAASHDASLSSLGGCPVAILRDNKGAYPINGDLTALRGLLCNVPF